MTKKATNMLVLTIVMLMVMLMLMVRMMVRVMVMVIVMVRMESRVSAERILTGEHDYGGRITGCVRSHQRSATPHSCSPSSRVVATTFQSAAQLATRKLSPQNQLHHCTGDLSAVGLEGRRSLFLAADSWSGVAQ